MLFPVFFLSAQHLSEQQQRWPARDRRCETQEIELGAGIFREGKLLF